MPRAKRPEKQTLRSTHGSRKLTPANSGFEVKCARLIYNQDGSIHAQEIDKENEGVADSIQFAYDSSRFNAGQVHLAFKEFMTAVMGAFPFRAVKVSKEKVPDKVIKHASHQ